MEYGTTICGQICDNNFMKYVGYTENNGCIKEYFSPETTKLISKKVTELTLGIDHKNRPILVPDKVICSVMSNIQDNYRPETGDIYSRYNIPSGGVLNMVQRMIDLTIEVIVNDIRVNLGMDECNRKLSIWTTVLGDFNKHGLRQHSKITGIRHKKPMSMSFFQNY